MSTSRRSNDETTELPMNTRLFRRVQFMTAGLVVALAVSLLTSMFSSSSMQALYNERGRDVVYPDHRNNSLNASSLSHKHPAERLEVTERSPSARVPSRQHASETSRPTAERQKSPTTKYTASQEADSPANFSNMNIVLFYADDWTFRTLGLINRHVQTPHIDALAHQGILFRYNCVTTSICWQSRASLMTGMYVAAHQFLKVSSEALFNRTVIWSHTLFPLLKKAGYHVGFVGKWHAPLPQAFREEAFDSFVSYYGRHWMNRRGKVRHVTELNGADAMEYLRRTRRRSPKKNQKFALTISFFATHSWDGKKYPDQYQPQPHSEIHYRNATIPVPKTATEQHWNDMPYFFTEQNEARVRWRQRYDTPDHYQETMKRYYRMATEVDDVVGMIVGELKRQGVYNNTLLIFTTDNGMFHGEHGLAGKWYPHEESIRVPLIIQDPRMPPHARGTVRDEFTLNVDLAPTILSAAGIPVPRTMQGRDIGSLYLLSDNDTAAAASWRTDFFYEWNQGSPQNAAGHRSILHIPAVFALIRKDYKYFLWPQANFEQVFNHGGIDPFEEVDIFEATAQSNVSMLEELQARYAFLKNLSQTGQPI